MTSRARKRPVWSDAQEAQMLTHLRSCWDTRQDHIVGLTDDGRVQVYATGVMPELDEALWQAVVTLCARKGDVTVRPS